VEYLIILIIVFLIALLFEFKYKIHLYHSLKERIIVTLNIFIIGFIWDWYATYKGHWSYPGTGLIGISFLGLPIEEVLFHLIAPYAIITTYKFYDERIK